MANNSAEPAELAENLRIDTDRGGYTIVDAAVIPVDQIELLCCALGTTADGERRRGGARSILRDVPSVRELAERSSIRDAAARVIGDRCFPVRAIYFDKTQDANWNVAWHQDLTIAVREKRPSAGFGPWSIKGGVVHVQPPIEILERMVTIRLHLDSSGIENGPLRVIPGSHRAGRLDPAGIEEWRKQSREVVCAARAGGLVVMRPLILHASSKAVIPAHRRVIHIEYAAQSLPHGLEWFEQQKVS